MEQKCENCKHAKFRRRLSSGQEFRRLLANALNEYHEPSRVEKYRMLEEIVKEFCKLGKINQDEKCDSYIRKWWKFGIVDDSEE